MLISSWLSSLQSKLQRRSQTATRRSRKLASSQHVASESLEVRALLSVTYDANQMFVAHEGGVSETTSSFGPFSAGHFSEASPGGFTPFPATRHTNNWLGDPKMQGWFYPIASVPVVAVNVSSSLTGAINTDPFQIHMHPGQVVSGGILDDAILRFTAPTTGSYSINGDWESLNGGVTNNMVRKNGGTLLASTANNSLINLTLPLTAGDRIDFVVNDFDGYGSDSTGLRVRVTAPDANAPPSIAANAAAVSANEGGTATNAGTFSDAQGNSTVAITASVGMVTKNDAGGTWSWSLSAADGPAGPFPVTITATDNFGARTNATFTYKVDNVVPSISLSGSPTVNEGSPYTLNLGVVTDPGQETITSYKIKWGDGVIDNFTGSPANTTATHTYADGPATQTHSVTLTDEDGNFLAGSLSVLVLNVAPTIALSGPSNINEGSLYTLNLGATTDPGADTVSAYSINWGDGSPVEYFSGSPAGMSKTHIYVEGSDYFTISVSLTDEDGTYESAGLLDVTVNNVAPTAPADGNSAANQVTENAAASTLVGITAASTDVGILDTVTYSLSDDAGGRFAINSSTGVVSVATGAVLDYEAATSHNITVRASDGQDATTETFTINLLNVTATISGTVFVDADGDGLFDGGSETAIDAVIVELYNSTGGLLDTDLTELGGAYAFVVNDEFATYRIRETQPTGVNEGAAILGSATVDSVISSNEMQLTLQGMDATDYDFTESGQGVQAGDTATIGFWQNKNGQALIKQGGPALVTWLNANFGNVFGNTFADGSGGDNDAEVASFYKNQFFSQKLKGTPKVDAQFMATAFATFFTSSNLSGGSVAASYGFNVTQTGIGTKVVNIGSSGAAFGVANNTNMTIMAILLATNELTGNNGSGYRNIYDTNGDGVLDDNEKALRVLANNVYSALNEGGDI